MTSPNRQAAGAGGAADAAPLASHEPAFFEKLLAGRAYVYTLPWRPLKSVAGFVLRPGGRTLICTYRGGGGRVTNRTHWRVLPTARYRAVLALYKDGDDPRERRFRAVPIYAGESGRLHQEGWHRGDLRYATRYDGWVQESWPRFLADACPDLVGELPEGMAINEKQTANTLEELRGQDPDAPLRRFPGWENAGLGGGSRQDLAAGKHWRLR